MGSRGLIKRIGRGFRDVRTDESWLQGAVVRGAKLLRSQERADQRQGGSRARIAWLDAQEGSRNISVII